MSAPVDVLAGIRLAARDCRAQGNNMAANELLDILGAVGGLIEGASAAHMALIGYLPAHRNAVTDAAIAKVSAALARVGGAAPAAGGSFQDGVTAWMPELSDHAGEVS